MKGDRVDRIMEQVEKIYQGDFLINGDWESSQRMSMEYRERFSSEYHGTNGLLGVGKMRCTDNCKLDGKQYIIPRDGVVYGPYFTFPAGSYYARFDIQGDLRACELSVFSQTAGDVASGIAAENVRDGSVILPFSLNEKVPDLELRVSNKGDGQLIFLGVEVFDHMEMSQKQKADENAYPKTRKIEVAEPHDIDLRLGILDEGRSEIVEDMNALIGMAQYTSTENSELQAAAPCDLPANTRFRAVKCFFRKLLNSFICFQQAFNQMLVRRFHTVGTQISMLTSAVKHIADYQWKLRENERFCLEQIAKLTEENARIKKTLAKIQEKCEESARNEMKLMEYTHSLEEKITQSDNTDQILNEVGALWNKIEEAVASLQERN